jgi:Na+-translocating ferredoxin:NAD+ oxidoreductase RnfG subunit
MFPQYNFHTYLQIKVPNLIKSKQNISKNPIKTNSNKQQQEKMQLLLQQQNFANLQLHLSKINSNYTLESKKKIYIYITKNKKNKKNYADAG